MLLLALPPSILQVAPERSDLTPVPYVFLPCQLYPDIQCRVLPFVGDTSTCHLFPLKFQTHISNCFLDTFIWVSR